MNLNCILFIKFMYTGTKNCDTWFSKKKRKKEKKTIILLVIILINIYKIIIYKNYFAACTCAYIDNHQKLYYFHRSSYIR